MPALDAIESPLATADVLASTSLAAPPLLIATDGSRGADAALRIGLALARRDRAPARVVTVYQPLPAFDAQLYPQLHEVDEALERELALKVRDQVARLHLDLTPEACEVLGGPVPETIAREAATRGAGLVVLGVGRHGARQVVAGHETALDVIRASAVPVLAVATDAASMPRRVVVATDFSRSSERALDEAVRLVGRRGAIFLVHVLPRIHRTLAATGEWYATYHREAGEQLDAAARRLSLPEDVRLERAVLVGDACSELLGFAASVDADLVATGTHGYSGMARALLGSVSTHVLRHAACSVLVAPPCHA